MKRQFWLAFSLALLLTTPVEAQVPPAGGPPTAPEAGPPSDRPPKTMNPIPNDPEPPTVKPKKPNAPENAAENDEEMVVRKPPSHRCFVRDIMAFYDRTHVRCYNRARGKFNFFAVDTGQPVAETVLLKAWRGMRSGKPLTITYAPSSDLNPANCATTNCRRLLDVLN